MSETPILHALSLAIGAAETASDAELLRRFVESGDRSAFELVVRRHAGLVWGVCCSALSRDRQTAEDAFQATFLALVRKAGSVRAGSAAGWLFRVARNAAVRARGRVAGRATDPLPDALAAADRPTDEQVALHEVAPVVAEEVDRLGSHLREPVVLCFFEGHTHAEAATRLGWPIGTVASRLARAKDLLRDRLTRRGVALPAGGFAAVFAVTGSPVRAAVAVATVPASQLSPNVRSLAKGVLSTMRFTKLKTIAVVAVVVLGVTTVAAALLGPAPEPPTPGSDKGPGDPSRAATDEKGDPEKLLKPLQGKWRVMSDVMSAQEVAVDPFGIADTDRLSRMLVTVDKDKMITDEGRMEATRLTVELKFPADGPRAIDLVVTDGPKELFGTAVPAIYKLDGNRLTLCVRDVEHLNKGRPKEFKGDKTQGLEVLERVTDESAELKALAGEWKGKKLILTSEEVLADRDVKLKWTLDGPNVVLAGEGELGERATIKLDPTETPPTVELTITQGKGKGTKLAGVYCRQENKLTLCFRDPKFKDAPPPAMLAIDGDVLYLVLERAPKAVKP